MARHGKNNVKVINMRSDKRIRQLSSGSTRSANGSLDEFWSSLDLDEYQAAQPAKRERTTGKTGQSSQSLLPFVTEPSVDDLFGRDGAEAFEGTKSTLDSFAETETKKSRRWRRFFCPFG